MNKNYPIHNDEIDFVFLIKTIWSQKLRLIIITLVTTLIGIGYVYLKPISFNITLKISPSNNSEFIKFLGLNEYLSSMSSYKNHKVEDETKNILINTHYVFNSFIKDFLDYDELVLVLKKNSYVKNNISQLTEDEQKMQLYKLAKKFKIERKKKLSKENDHVILEFNWHNIDDAKKILDETFNLVLNNLEKNIFFDLNYMFELEQNIDKRRDATRIDYLLEQSEIAKALDIENNEIDSLNLNDSSISFNILRNYNQAYYLRGFKAIDKEIEIIKKRQFRYLDSAVEEINMLKDGKKVTWVDYNLYLINAKSLKNSPAIILSSTLIGLILGIFYILSINTYVTQKSYKRKM